MDSIEKRNELYESLAPIDVSLKHSQAILTALADQFQDIELAIKRRKNGNPEPNYALISNIVETRWETWANLVDLARNLNASQRSDLEALE